MTAVNEVQQTERTQLRRKPDRGRYDRALINEILDEALTCHLGFTDDHGQPFVLPTIHARVDDTLYMHGSAASGMLRHLGRGVPMCCTVTIVDGIVVARTSFHSSMNYRSVIILGTGRLVDDPDEKAAAFDAVVEHVIAGRTNEVRQPTQKEVAATKVLALPIEEASAKVRVGDPVDDEEDVATDVWAGILARRDQWLAPLPAADLRDDIPVPASVNQYSRPSPTLRT